jgi:3-hydroxyacyl-[acyl-carrier-protein] dehydratase
MMEALHLDINGIHEYQQNRYPFLFVDAVEEVVPGERVRGYKNLTINDWFFKPHFPGRPTMPGVLQLEALMQIGALTILTMEGHKGEVAFATSVDKTRFLREVVPGDRLDLEVAMKSWRRGIGKFSAQASVRGEVTCMAEFTLVLPSVVEKNRNMLPKQERA